MSIQVETLIEKSIDGEGPHWDERSQTLLYVDINDGYVHRWSAETGKDERHKFDTFCTMVVPCRKGGYLVSIGKSICHFDWETKTHMVTATVDEGKDTRINDGKCDPSGRLWFGTMGLEKTPAVVEEHQGSLYSLELDGTVRKHKEGVTISNGLAWTADKKTMYFIDSIPRKVFAYDFDIQTGTMSNERVAVDMGGKETMDTLGFPDGMAIDTEDKIWVTCFFAGKIIRFDPETGEQLASVNVPVKQTTSCCFGGKNFDEMFITSSAFGVTAEEAKEIDGNLPETEKNVSLSFMSTKSTTPRANEAIYDLQRRSNYNQLFRGPMRATADGLCFATHAVTGGTSAINTSVFVLGNMTQQELMSVRRTETADEGHLVNENVKGRLEKNVNFWKSIGANEYIL